MALPAYDRYRRLALGLGVQEGSVGLTVQCFDRTCCRCDCNDLMRFD